MKKVLLEKIFVCPKCKSPLDWHETSLTCSSNDCGAVYASYEGILHFERLDAIEDEYLSVTIDAYDQTAANFANKHNEDDIDKWVYKPAAEHIKKHYHGTMLLDAGSGIGRDSDFLAQYGYDVVGVDMSINMIKEGIRYGHYCLSIPVVGNLSTLPFSKDSFDIIWACASLLHTPKGERFERILNQFHFVLKQNGILYLVMMKSDERFYEDGWEYKEKRGKRYFSYFTLGELEALLLRAGFELLPIDFPEENAPLDPDRPFWIHVLAKAV